MNELNQSSPIDQRVSKIYEEMSGPDLSFPRVVDYLRDLRIKEEYQSLSNTEYYDIVGETIKLNPDIFMKHIYGDRRFYQYNNSEMQKYILEKISLYEGEQILFEDSGKIIQESRFRPKTSLKNILWNFYIWIESIFTWEAIFIEERENPEFIMRDVQHP